MRIWAFALMFISGLISCQSNANSSSENAEQLVQQDVIAVSLDTENWLTKMQELPGKILDVRTDSEYADGFIEGALHADVLEASFVSDLEQLSLNKAEPIYVYCRSGGRSKKAMEMLKDQGFVQIYELDNGIMGWQKAGKPIVK